VIKIKPALLAGIPFALALILSCSSNIKESDSGDKGNNIDNYKIANIDSLKWLAENLDYDVEGSKCYDNDPANCAIYGRLYNWATAMALPPDCNSIECSSQIQQPNHRGICPPGWHIPSNADWDKLLHYADSTKEMIGTYESPTAGKYLKSTSGWKNGGNGTDEFGFSALPGGYSGLDGTFYHIGDGGYWWSASEAGGSAARRRMRYNRDGVGLLYLGKSSLLSVRCLLD
jgi:uncharacterized protein (TIGR02145 family)